MKTALHFLLLFSGFLAPDFANAGAEKSSVRTPSSQRDCHRQLCPRNIIHCPEGTTRVDVREEGACCPKWDCQEAGDEENDCSRVRCMQKMPNCKAGERAVDERKDGACCPKYVCRETEARDCSNAKCPKNFIHCPSGTERVDVREPGACCPRFKCEKKKRGVLHDAVDEGEDEDSVEE